VKRAILYLTFCGLMGICLSVPQQAHAEDDWFDISRPNGKTSFITDMAKLISPEDAKKINESCAKLLKETATPIIVVTIPSVGYVCDENLTVDGLAREIFNTWGIGHQKISVRKYRYGSGKTVDHNRGILLLVSSGDRKARIELGAGWGRDKDKLCKQIMDDIIVRNFKKDKFSTGIMRGIAALDAMARGEKIPVPPRPMWHYLVVVGFVGLVIFTIFSLIRRGSSGWAWLFWGAIFAILGVLLYKMLTSRGGSGGFSGGSFGGGFSGGGGASGSW
jgi:uncharacterized protein